MYFYHHVLSFYTHLSSTYTIRYFIFYHQLQRRKKGKLTKNRLFCLYTTEPGCLSISTSLFFRATKKSQPLRRPTLSIKKILFGLKDTYVDIYIVCQKRAIYIKKKDRSKERERGTKIHIQKTKTSERRWYD